MRVEVANEIMKLIDGFEMKDGLATIGHALIHICHVLGVEKQTMLDAMSRQWDVYERNHDRDTRLH